MTNDERPGSTGACDTAVRRWLVALGPPSFARLPRAYTTFEGHRVAYAVAGSGPTVLLLHGLGGTADFWQPAIARLRDEFTLLAPDLLGFGFSDKPRVRYTLARHMGAMLAVLLASGTTGLHAVVGHSAGGIVAVALLASGLARARRLALAASAYPTPRFAVRQELVTRAWFGRLLDNRRLARADDAVWQAIWPLLRRVGNRRVPEYLQGGWAGFMDYSADSLYDTAAELLFRTDLDPLLARLGELPTLLLYGARDQTVPAVHGRRLAEALPHARLVEVDAGHYAAIHEGLPALAHWLAARPHKERMMSDLVGSDQRRQPVGQ